MKATDKFYTPREEKVNYLTHGVALLISIAATILLLRRAIIADNRWGIAAYALFGFGMISCMGSSTVYHYVQQPLLKLKLRHFDHAAIYLLIAASYSPVTLMLLREETYWGWALFAVIWMIAVAGIALSFRTLKKNSHLKTLSYVMMGLIVLMAFKPFIEVSAANDCMRVVYWIIAGGAFYITGALIYAMAKKEFIHAVFHLFVLLGLLSHIYAAWLIPL